MGFLDLFRRSPRRVERSRSAADLFKRKYSHFKALLESNTELLEIISDMEEKLKGDHPFGMALVRSQASRAVFHMMRMVTSFDGLSGNRRPNLRKAADAIREQIAALVEVGREQTDCGFILPYTAVGKEMVDCVGGKSANLGEMQSRVGVPVPDGFAVTTAGYDAVARAIGPDEIRKLEQAIDPDDPASIVAASEAIQRLFLTVAFPADLGAALRGAYAGLCERAGRPEGIPVALRSSAIGEDSELSFAGQYLSVLNVGPGDIEKNYLRVLASLFTPRAIAYRLHKGIAAEGISMAVACLVMVDSAASGVIYTSHPLRPLDNTVLVNAVWGLGPYAVDGVVTPDAYHVTREPPLSLAGMEIPVKPVRLASREGGGLTEMPVAPELADKPCLTEAEVLELAGHALRLEEHFGSPQDVEWARDAAGRLLILQARPLQLARGDSGTRELGRVAGAEVVLEGGDIASAGVGSGPAVLVAPGADLARVPEGAILVAEHSSPKFALVLQKTAGIVTDHGSVTGHMASLAREFGVPALLNARTATRDIRQGEVLTLDAFSGRVYRGEVPEILRLRRTRHGYMKGSPVYETLRKVADLVVPLHLLDPKSPDFRPVNCRTVHDVMRLVHEFSYAEMFAINDQATDEGSFSLKLQADIPLDLYIIDLGGGLKDVPGQARAVAPEQVASAPFAALLRGMLHEGVTVRGPKPIDMRGFLSVMQQQMLGPAGMGGERFGDKSYALISDKYLNFSSRVGYHYSILDSYCGKTVNKNYVTFQFKGGAADDVRRNRRVRAIARILESLGFTVEVSGDMVRAAYQKYEPQAIAARLDQLGRLLQFTRQMDMLMRDEGSVERVAACFLEGRYDLGCD